METQLLLKYKMSLDGVVIQAIQFCDIIHHFKEIKDVFDSF